MYYSFVTGVILRERILAFEMMLWRVCRGKVFLKQAELDSAIEDPITVCIMYFKYIERAIKNYLFITRIYLVL